tara:strand:+ start:183 stop:725 length:543 start_codon:yes stop_codon:yes gene_type:complete
MSGKVVITDSPKVREFFQKIKPNCFKTLHLALRDTADAIEAKAIENVSEKYKQSTKGKDGGAYDTGRLASSMRGVVEENEYKFKIGSPLPYAGHMEFGTGPAIGRPAYRPPDGKLAPWSKRHSKDEDAVLQSIMRFGTQPRRFLGRAFAEKKGILPERFAKILARKLSMAAQKNIKVTRR